MRYDLDLLFFLNSFAGQSALGDRIIVFFAAYLPYALILLFLLFAARSHEKARTAFVPLIAAGIARFGITEGIRFFYRRPRPFAVYPVRHLIIDMAASFPSGHAAFFFALAAAVYHYDKKWGTGFLAGALCIGIARIAAGVHYPSDIIGGMIIGIAAGTLIPRILDKNR